MAVSLKKLKIGKGKLTAAEVVGYLADPQDVGDYYTEDSKAFISWVATGRVRTLFALGDDVQQSTLADLIEGIDPVTGELIRRYGPDGTIVGAIDLTVSPAPKSVSILWALADDELRYELEVMVTGAAAVAVGRLLREQPLTRERYGPGPADVAPAVAEDYVGASVLHTAARLSANSDGVPDPQLHVHNLLIGAVDAHGRLRAIDSLAIMRFQAELDAEASGQLAAVLRTRGFSIVRRLEQRPGRQPRVKWEIAGIPPPLVEAMSKRTSEIEDLQLRYREETGREPIGHAWDAWLALQRGPKAHLTSAELRAAWLVEAERHGLDLAAVDDLIASADRVRASGVEERDERSPEAEEFRRLMLENVCRNHAYVAVAAMERLARQFAVGLIAPRTADVVIADMVGDGDLLVTTDDQVTTLEVLRYEQRVRTAADVLLTAAPRTPVERAIVERELRRRAAEGRPFDDRQADAIRLAVSGARFVSITGPAGTGKGFASAAISKLWRGQGRRVLAVAVAGRTAQQAAADAGADEAVNIDLLLARMEHGILALDARDVILVDEAGVVDHERYARLLEAAVRSGATVVQVGDDRQLSPVGPGGLWTVTHRMAAAAGRATELAVVRRARDPREAKAWGDLRHGRIAEALTWMRDDRRLVLYDTRPELLAGLVDRWWAGDHDGLMVVDTSNAERDRLNEMAQARRLVAGQLGDEVVRLQTGCELRCGDRVLFSGIYRPEPKRGSRLARVENGTPATVVHVDASRQRATVELAEGDEFRRIELGPDAPLELGYARHVAKAQGVTREDTDLAVSNRTRRNELYVMATRARSGARFHGLTADVAELLDGTNEPAHTPMTAAQAAVLERRGVVPNPDWTWVQASLQIDVAVGTPVGRQATLWLEAQGHSREAAGKIVEAARGTRPTSGHGYPSSPSSGMTVAEMDEQIEADRARREAAVEEATIRAIHRQAERPSTKEAVGHRLLRSGGHWRETHRAIGSSRRDAERVDLEQSRADTDRKWEHSLRLDARVPRQTRDASRRAAQGEVIGRSRRAPVQRPPEPLPARDIRESVLGRRRVDELATALAYYQLAGCLEQTRTPADRALELLADDPRAVVVIVTTDLWREVIRRAEHVGLQLELDGRQRVLQADPAYQARLKRRQAWRATQPPEAAHVVEPDVERAAQVVAGINWTADELSRALSVAAESHVVLPPLRSRFAQEVSEESERLRLALEARAVVERERSQARARDLAHEPSPETEVARGAEPEEAGR